MTAEAAAVQQAQQAMAAQLAAQRQAQREQTGLVSSLLKASKLPRLLEGLRHMRLSATAPLGAAADGRLKIKTKGRTLDSTGAASYAFLLPLLAWGVLAVTAFGVAYQKLKAAPSPMTDLNAATLAAGLATRVRMHATDLVLAASRGAPAAQISALQAALMASAGALLAEHVAMLDGDTRMGLSGSLYRSPARDALLFGQARRRHCRRPPQRANPSS